MRSTSNETLGPNQREDYLNRKPYAETIVSEILTPKSWKDDSIEASTYAICGSWGSGKTHLLNQVSKILAKRGFLVVCFKAWEFELEGNLTTSLVRALADPETYEFSGEDDELKDRLIKPAVKKALKAALTSSIELLCGLDQRLSLGASLVKGLLS